MTDFAIVGKWYKVIKGHYKGFVGECVTNDIGQELPIILQDINFKGCAVKPDEIKLHINQPQGAKLKHREQN